MDALGSVSWAAGFFLATAMMSWTLCAGVSARRMGSSHSPNRRPAEARAPVTSGHRNARQTHVDEEKLVIRRPPRQRRHEGGVSGLLRQQDQLARIAIIEQHPGPLIQHVGVDAVGFEELDAALPQLALRR